MPAASLKNGGLVLGARRRKGNFRGHVPAASLKKAFLEGRAPNPWVFPRARARGLIEDVPAASAAAGQASHFRGHVPAASLKRRRAHRPNLTPCGISAGTCPRPH